MQCFLVCLCWPGQVIPCFLSSYEIRALGWVLAVVAAGLSRCSPAIFRHKHFPLTLALVASSSGESTWRSGAPDSWHAAHAGQCCTITQRWCLILWTCLYWFRFTEFCITIRIILFNIACMFESPVSASSRRDLSCQLPPAAHRLPSARR